MAKGPKLRVVELTWKITHDMLNFPGEPRPGFVQFRGLSARR
jgi:hypothetical protein